MTMGNGSKNVLENIRRWAEPSMMKGTRHNEFSVLGGTEKNMWLDCGERSQKSEVGKEQITKSITSHKSMDFILITMERHWQALSLGVTKWDLIKHNSFSFRT